VAALERPIGDDVAGGRAFPDLRASTRVEWVQEYLLRVLCRESSGVGRK
jgi:hypothetical protein